MSFDIDHWLVETYESIFDTDAFFDQLEALNREHRSLTCALHVEGPGIRGLDLVIGADPSMVAQDYPKFRNLWLERGVGDLLATGVTHDALHTRVAEMARTDYHRHLLAPLGIDHSIGILCDQRANGGFTMLSLSRSRSDGPFDDSDVQRFLALRPHLRTLIRLRTRAVEQQRRSADRDGLLDRARTPRLLLDGQLRVRAANHAADSLLAEGELIGLAPQERLSIPDPRARKRFRESIAAGGAFELMLLGAGGRRRAVLQVEPMQPFEAAGRTRYLVTLAPLARDLGAPAARLRSLFGLTPREAELTHALAGQFDLRRAAESIEMSYETARSHLKHCFEKTATRSQVELVALVRDVFGVIE